MMRLHLYRIYPAVLPLMFVSACFGGDAKEEFFYRLTGPSKAVERGKGPTLQLASFVASAGYDTARIAIRTSPHEITYYGYRQWASEPARLLSEMTLRHLQASHLFSEVSNSDRMREPDVILEGRVIAIEQVDTSTTTWSARLAMTLVARKGQSEKVLLRHAFDARRPCERRHPDEVAKGVSRILESEIKRLAPRVAAAFR